MVVNGHDAGGSAECIVSCVVNDKAGGSRGRCTPRIQTSGFGRGGRLRAAGQKAGARGLFLYGYMVTCDRGLSSVVINKCTCICNL